MMPSARRNISSPLDEENVDEPEEPESIRRGRPQAPLDDFSPILNSDIIAGPSEDEPVVGVSATLHLDTTENIRRHKRQKGKKGKKGKMSDKYTEISSSMFPSFEDLAGPPQKSIEISSTSDSPGHIHQKRKEMIIDLSSSVPP